MTPALSTANPRRTTLAALSGSRCEVAGPGCRTAATRLLLTPSGAVPACSACAPR